MYFNDSVCKFFLYIKILVEKFKKEAKEQTEVVTQVYDSKNPEEVKAAFEEKVQRRRRCFGSEKQK